MKNILNSIFSRSKNVQQSDAPIQDDIPDTPLANYLKYYSTLDNPGYAVLVTGPWGVGKTFQVKQVIPESKRYLISLYGLESVTSIHDAVLASSLPNHNVSEHVSTFSEVAKAAGDKYAIAGIATSVWNAVLRQRLKPTHTLIFDDLERSPLWKDQKSELLGAINYYVEHRGFRVIVICHDEHIEDELAKLKEKTFGHTVKATPQTKIALDKFLSDIKDETNQAFVTKKRKLIEEIWMQSDQSSLRILKYVINDVVRLREALTAKHLDNDEAIDHVLRFFCALNIEVRSGNLPREFLAERMQRYISESRNRDADEIDKPFTTISSRYTSVDLAETVLSDEIVLDTLINGRFNVSSIATWLDQTHYFIEPSEADPWLVAMKFDELDDVSLNEGIERMQKQFDERSVTIMGEFLHIAALRLMMVEQKFFLHSMDEETAFCLAYVDDLVKANRMPAKPLGHVWPERHSSYGGYGYWVSEISSPHFVKICEYIDRAQLSTLEANYPKYAEEVLVLMKEDPYSLSQAISTTNSYVGTFGHNPILACIQPSTFLDAWLNSPRSEWRAIEMALNNRYKHGQLERELRNERSWLNDLEKEIDQRINKATGLDAFRLKRIKPKIFDQL